MRSMDLSIKIIAGLLIAILVILTLVYTGSIRKGHPNGLEFGE
jgi:hypothetical protein